MSNDDARQRLLNVAGPIFAEKGFQAATVRDICQAAGVNVAAVNYHFGDKHQLYVEMIRQAHRCRFQNLPPFESDRCLEPADRLRAIVRQMLIHMLTPPEQPWHAQLMIREMLEPTGAATELVGDLIRPHHEFLVATLAELAGQHVPKYRLQQLAFSIVGQCMYYRLGGEVMRTLIDSDDLQHFDVNTLADHIAEVILAAVGAAPRWGDSEQAAALQTSVEPETHSVAAGSTSASNAPSRAALPGAWPMT